MTARKEKSKQKEKFKNFENNKMSTSILLQKE
ncbi:hypothetical protein IWQ47_005018 [Aquimarina sp. EL_43]|nr:hypothetical protein [Aquimarina sp. EL_35]MBG6153763.1 hypothetical protein [Aquimarina sp. EL_32]MBG6171919.1 hypothetical protein [Aquimarina sp. EL_43]